MMQWIIAKGWKKPQTSAQDHVSIWVSTIQSLCLWIWTGDGCAWVATGRCLMKGIEFAPMRTTLAFHDVSVDVWRFAVEIVQIQDKGRLRPMGKCPVTPRPMGATPMRRHMGSEKPSGRLRPLWELNFSDGNLVSSRCYSWGLGMNSDSFKWSNSIYFRRNVKRKNHPFWCTWFPTAFCDTPFLRAYPTAVCVSSSFDGLFPWAGWCLELSKLSEIAVFLQSAVPCFHACGFQVYSMSKSNASFIQFHSNSRLFAYLQKLICTSFSTQLCPVKEKITTLAPFWISVVHPKPSTFLTFSHRNWVMAGCWAKAYPGSEMGAATPGGATAATSEAAVEEKAGNVGRANWIQLRRVLMFDSHIFCS